MNDKNIFWETEKADFSSKASCCSFHGVFQAVRRWEIPCRGDTLMWEVVIVRKTDPVFVVIGWPALPKNNSEWRGTT
jgi:hypothetical protein